jgi:hypothetical protein
VKLLLLLQPRSCLKQLLHLLPLPLLLLLAPGQQPLELPLWRDLMLLTALIAVATHCSVCST